MNKILLLTFILLCQTAYTQTQIIGSIIDGQTKETLIGANVIEKGRRNVEILKQSQNDPFTVENQTAIIYAGSKNLLRNVPVNQVKAFERAYLDVLNAKHRPVLDSIKAGKLTDEIKSTLETVAADLSSKYAN